MVKKLVFSIVVIIISICIGIGMWLYIKKQDNASISDINNQKNQNEVEKPNSILDMAKQKLSIDDISNGVITLENYKKRSILLKIKNSDFNMLSEESQEVTENILRQLALSLQYDVSFYSTTRVIDTSKPLIKAKQVLNNTDNQAIQRYAINYINTFDSIMTANHIAEREDYIILTYTGDMKQSVKELERRAAQFITVLKKINTKCELVSTEGIINLIYHDLNRNDYFNPSKSIKLGALDLYVGHNKKEAK